MYFGDVLRYGMTHIAEDAIAFASQIRGEKDPLVREDVDEETIKKEFEKAYA